MRCYRLTLPKSFLTAQEILSIEAAREADYIGDSQMPIREVPEGVTPEWSRQAAAFFWQANPPPGYKSIFAVVHQPGKGVVIMGPNGFDGVVEAVYSASKPYYVSYSAHGHDFHSIDPMGNVCVDGGRNYMRIVGDPGTYHVGKLDLITRTLYDQDGEPIGECKVKGPKT